MRLERYDSIEGYAKLVAKESSKSHGSSEYTGYNHSSWNDGVSFKKSIQLAIEGDPALVSKYTEFVDKLVNDFTINQDVRKRYVSAVAGSRVSVPEYLGGSPYCMKRRMPREISTRSVNIYVSTTCSAGVDAANMLKRGATILALLEYLQQVQVSVKLYLLAETHGRTDGDLIQAIQVQSHPLDLSTAGFAIAHPAFARNITYEFARITDGFNGDWGAASKKPNYVEKLRKLLGMQEKDIYIGAPKSWLETIMKEPEKWLAENIQTIKGTITNE